MIKDDTTKMNSSQAGKLLQVLPNIRECDKKLFYPRLLGKSSFQEMHSLAI